MKLTLPRVSLLIPAVLFLTACNDKREEPGTVTSSSPAISSVATPSSTAASSVPASLTDTWQGKWNGPEGTFLEITGSAGNYALVIQDLDGPKTYEGVSSGEQIQFQRNGQTEVIRATNGADTGMKWLADKSNCLTIKSGEGFCRD